MWKADTAKTIFEKRSLLDVWQGSEHTSGSEYVRVWNIPG